MPPPTLQAIRPRLILRLCPYPMTPPGLGESGVDSVVLSHSGGGRGGGFPEWDVGSGAEY